MLQKEDKQPLIANKVAPTDGVANPAGPEIKVEVRFHGLSVIIIDV